MLRDAMSIEDKASQGCRCMGVAVFDPESCNFPGLGQYYKPEVDQPAPQEPPPLDAKPSEPEFPPAPEPPEDENDQVATVGYLNALKAYQDEVGLLQDQYRSDMELYEAKAKVFEAQMEDYQSARLTYEGARAEAINTAEGLIKNVREEFGWAFVNKNDPEVFWPWMLKTWFAQMTIMLVYITLILIIFKRKDIA